MCVCVCVRAIECVCANVCMCVREIGEDKMLRNACDAG